jgi:hypothetical protein
METLYPVEDKEGTTPSLTEPMGGAKTVAANETLLLLEGFACSNCHDCFFRDDLLSEDVVDEDVSVEFSVVELCTEVAVEFCRIRDKDADTPSKKEGPGCCFSES